MPAKDNEQWFESFEGTDEEEAVDETQQSEAEPEEATGIEEATDVSDDAGQAEETVDEEQPKESKVPLNELIDERRRRQAAEADIAQLKQQAKRWDEVAQRLDQ